jgi:transposase
LRAAGDDTLGGSKYLWLYAAENLSEQHRQRFAQLKATILKTGRAWPIKESLRELWHYTRVGWAERHWKRWYFWATHSRLTPVIETARFGRARWRQAGRSRAVRQDGGRYPR